MPRIYTSESDPIDFCIKCFPKSEDIAFEKYENRGNCFCYDDDHPDYKDTDYKSETCNKKLTQKDNYLI